MYVYTYLYVYTCIDIHARAHVHSHKMNMNMYMHVHMYMGIYAKNPHDHHPAWTHLYCFQKEWQLAENGFPTETKITSCRIYS